MNQIKLFYLKLFFFSLGCLFSLQSSAKSGIVCNQVFTQEKIISQEIFSNFSKLWHLEYYNLELKNNDTKNNFSSINYNNRPLINLNLLSLNLLTSSFKDKENRTFHLVKLKNNTFGLNVPLFILHSDFGLIENEGWSPGFYDGIQIRSDGVIDGRQLFIEWPLVYQNKGFLSGFFEVLNKLVKEGTEYWIYDGSKTYNIESQIMKIPSQKIISFINETFEGRTLYKTYLEASQYLFFKHDIRTNINPATDTQFIGFRRYLVDFTTIHGRICRHGNFRTPFLFNEEESQLKIRIKIDLPVQIIEAENQLLSEPSSIQNIYSYLNLKAEYEK